MTIATATCLVVVYLGVVVFADARWWNLVMAALLLAGGIVIVLGDTRRRE